MSHLTDDDLKQMNNEWLERQPPNRLLTIAGRLLDDLRQARDRLNKDSTNSSIPSGSLPPWSNNKKVVPNVVEERGKDNDADDDDPGAQASDTNLSEKPKTPSPCNDEGGPATDASCAEQALAKRRPGKQPKAQGYGRTQTLEVTATQEHHPMQCAACAGELSKEHASTAWTAWDQIELLESVPGRIGLRFSVTQHRFFKRTCVCGHVTTMRPHRVASDSQWNGIEISEQRLLGPRFVAMLVYLSTRVRGTRRVLEDFLYTLLGLEISVGCLHQAIQEAARACAPLEAEIIQELEKSPLLHVDETTWKQGADLVWLWVIRASFAALFRVGSRTKATFEQMLSGAFSGIIMSDGYGVYRHFVNRLRCWAHLKRKLKGLAESTNPEVAKVGALMQAQFRKWRQAIYEARKAPTQQAAPQDRCAQGVLHFYNLCQAHRASKHDELRKVAVEFLNDWDVITRPLADPSHPLTNNEAERALRHHVIVRRITYGTRNEVGSRSYGLIASVMETCRLRSANVIDFFGQVIEASRKGFLLPSLPAIPTHALG